MLTPEDIANKQFTVRTIGKGYDPDEVDDFLDSLMVAYGDALRQAQAAQSKASTATTQQIPVQYGDAARLLGVAQQTADQQIAEAKAKASKMLDDAQAQGAQMLSDAQAQAKKLVDDANTQAAQIVAQGNSKRHEIIGQLEVQRSDLQSHVDALAQAKATAAAALKEALDKVGGSPDAQA